MTNDSPDTNRICTRITNTKEKDDHKSGIFQIRQNACFKVWQYPQSTHISDGEESFIKKQHHPKEEEKYTEACQPHADFCCKYEKIIYIREKKLIIRRKMTAS